jgi:transcriptional regulator with XRE-family HTH domain
MKKKYTHLEIGQRLKELRKFKINLSQEEFSEKIGLHLNTYRRYESGERLPPEPVLKRVAELCGKTVDWLLGRERDLASIIATARAENEAEKAELASLAKLVNEKLVSSLGTAYTQEERELMIKLVMILRGENKDNRKAIIENIHAFYKTRNVVDMDRPGETKKTNCAG